jgi:hypothetical protein
MIGIVQRLNIASKHGTAVSRRYGSIALFSTTQGVNPKFFGGVWAGLGFKAKRLGHIQHLDGTQCGAARPKMAAGVIGESSTMFSATPEHSRWRYHRLWLCEACKGYVEWEWLGGWLNRWIEGAEMGPFDRGTSGEDIV